MAKKGIHPDYKPATITCACGHIHETFSVRGSFAVEICSSCHPFFTGKQKLLDKAGRVERFRKRYSKSDAGKAEAAAASEAEASSTTS